MPGCHMRGVPLCRRRETCLAVWPLESLIPLEEEDQPSNIAGEEPINMGVFLFVFRCLSVGCLSVCLSVCLYMYINHDLPARQGQLSLTSKYHRGYCSVFLLFQGDQGIQRPYGQTGGGEHGLHVRRSSHLLTALCGGSAWPACLVLQQGGQQAAWAGWMQHSDTHGPSHLLHPLQDAPPATCCPSVGWP